MGAEDFHCYLNLSVNYLASLITRVCTFLLHFLWRLSEIIGVSWHFCVGRKILEMDLQICLIAECSRQCVTSVWCHRIIREKNGTLDIYMLFFWQMVVYFIGAICHWELEEISALCEGCGFCPQACVHLESALLSIHARPVGLIQEERWACMSCRPETFT